ncbi:RNA polymerase sigma factor [Streptomyces sp. NPDC001297]|uniref:RNA polymerase sigma factor n=1 Tax=Streptomyces sp. NPDC001297 TaxID=3364559 RepID=UPI0036A3E66E
MADRIDAPQRPLSAASAERLDRLFRLYNPRVVRLARQLANNADHADDIAATTWLAASRSVDSLRADDDHAMGWLATITRHAVRDFYAPRRAHEVPSDWTDAVTAVSLPAAPAADADLYTLVGLAPEVASVLELAAEGLMPTAIGRRFGWHRSVVVRRLEAGARSLRDLMADDDHNKVKDPLPPRPRGPHPYPARLALAGGAR